MIEQEVVTLNLVSSILRQDGHTVMAASDPIEALGIVERQGHNIDLVVTDVDTTPISGFEFMKRVTGKGIDIPVLFTSGSPNLTGVIAATLGDHAVIAKPFSPSALRKRVGRFLAKRRHRPSAGRESETDIQAA